VFFKIFYVKYFRKDIIKVQVVGSLYIHRLLHGKMKIKIKNKNKKTLHVSDSSSVQHQEFFTVHTAMVYVI